MLLQKSEKCYLVFINLHINSIVDTMRLYVHATYSQARYSACVRAHHVCSVTLSPQFTIIGITNKKNGTSHEITTGVLVILSILLNL